LRNLNDLTVCAPLFLKHRCINALPKAAQSGAKSKIRRPPRAGADARRVHETSEFVDDVLNVDVGRGRERMTGMNIPCKLFA